MEFGSHRKRNRPDFIANGNGGIKKSRPGSFFYIFFFIYYLASFFALLVSLSCFSIYIQSRSLNFRLDLLVVGT